LGSLNYMKIWHDNSGKGDSASWYSKHILVNDLQTNEKFYFICEQWLAVEKGDGKLDRDLFVAFFYILF
jgi:polycystin 1L2